MDYELADTLEIDTAERMKALGDPLRLLIVDLVLERAMSVTELAERVGRPRGSVAHHVKLLERAGLLQVVRTRKVRAIEERFYGRAATTYVMAHQSDGLPFLKQVLAEFDTAHETGPDRPAGVTYRRARIPADRAAEIRRTLDAAGARVRRRAAARRCRIRDVPGALPDQQDGCHPVQLATPARPTPMAEIDG